MASPLPPTAIPEAVKRLMSSARTVLLPAALPEIVTGLRIGFSATLLGTLIGELFASDQGLGFMLIRAMEAHKVLDIVALTLRINDFLSGLLLGVGITLVDFKLEFGRLWENDEMRIILADEISPDNCRLWDSKTNEKMDKDRFRRDLGNVEEGYQEVARRLGILPEAGMRDLKGPELMQ